MLFFLAIENFCQQINEGDEKKKDEKIEQLKEEFQKSYEEGDTNYVLFC